MFGPVGGAVRPGPESKKRAEATFRPLLDAVRRAIDAGVFRAEDPLVIADALWAGAHGFVSLELRELLQPTADDPDELYRKVMRASSAGWLADRSA
jgi:hypothetical protein